MIRRLTDAAGIGGSWPGRLALAARSRRPASPAPIEAAARVRGCFPAGVAASQRARPVCESGRSGVSGAQGAVGANPEQAGPHDWPAAPPRRPSA